MTAAPVPTTANLPLAETPVPSPPAAVYVTWLAVGSRRPMAQALDAIAALGGKDAASLPWHMLRSAHTAVIRAALAGHDTTRRP